jgi:hypothetical protein
MQRDEESPDAKAAGDSEQSEICSDVADMSADRTLGLK